MNVRGFNQEGEEAELQISEQSESFLAISKRFQQAMASSPSEESENLLKSIISDVTTKESSDYEKMLVFQCNREIARSKIQRELFTEAIPYLIDSLKFDQSRTNLWADLAKCAQKSQNNELYRAAIAKVKKLRPQLKFNLSKPSIPDYVPRQTEPRFIGFAINNQCWRHFLEALKMGHITDPCAIPIFQCKDEVQYQPHERKYYVSDNIMQGFYQEPHGKTIYMINRCTVLEFLAKLGADLISPNTWLFNTHVSNVLANTLNMLAEIRYTEPIPGEAAIDMIDLASDYVFDRLTPNARLFYAELAAEYQIISAPHFINGILQPLFHLPNAYLRLVYIELEIAISQNRRYAELNRLLGAFKKHLKEPVNLGHISLRIDQKLLDEKTEQIEILHAIDIPSTKLTVEMAAQYFSPRQPLAFLSLKNVVKLFMQFNDDMVKGILVNFLHMLPNHIRQSTNEISFLDQLFQRFTYAMNDECVKELGKIFKTLNEVNANKTTLYHCAIAYAYASVVYENRAKVLAKMHVILGNMCHFDNGRFLELLISALLNDPSRNEIDLTKAFGCYFTDVAISAHNHDSKLKLRCSPLMQPFYEHLKALEDKHATNPNNFFVPYLNLWMHYLNERVNEEPCLTNIDGWRIYKVVKRFENKITKTIKMPPGMTTTSLLEGMLRNDPTNSPESRIALQKIIIKRYFQERMMDANTRIFTNMAPGEAKIPNNTANLEEVLKDIASEENPTPYQKLIHAIIYSFIYHDKIPALNELFEITAFADSPKKEARRLYWIMRLMEEIGMIRDERMGQILQYSLQFVNTYATNKLPPEFSILILCQIARISGDAGITRKAIEVFCKSKIVLPHPYLELSKHVDPPEAYKLLQKLIRLRVLNLNNIMNFEWRVPFLMCAPQDLENIRHEIIDGYIDNAAKSGNYQIFFNFINPNCRPDRKLSKVFRESRFVFGIDRAYIFVRYFTELIKEYNSNDSKKKREQNDRAIDALVKSEHILNLKTPDGVGLIVPLALRTQIKDLQNGFIGDVWAKMLNTDVPPNATVNDLLKQLYQMGDDDEEEDEEDGDFVDDDNSEEEDDDDEDATANDNEEEELDDGNQDEYEEDDEEADAVETDGGEEEE